MFFRLKSSGKHSYLQIVESFRVGKKVRQRVIANFGRYDRLARSGALERLLANGARFTEKAAVLTACDDPDAISLDLGPGLVFDRLWQLSGCRATLRAALRQRGFRFDVERAVFLTVLHRLCAPGSDRSALRWARDQVPRGWQHLQLQHLYRAMAWLGEELPAAEQDQRTHAPRCVKDLLEEDLFARRRHLFSSLDLVFFDTTSHYFHGQGGQSLGRRGFSKDSRPQCRQMIVGLVLDEQGLPVCTEMWPGNVADVTALVPVAERLQRRFGIGSVCLVADRGMISQATMEAIEARGWTYILGCRMRSTAEFRERVLGSDAEEVVLQLQRAHNPRQPLELRVRDVTVGARPAEEGRPAEPGRRYVVCRNEEQARRDRAVREELVAKLRQALQGGAKGLVGNRGYRRYLQAAGGPLPAEEGKEGESAGTAQGDKPAQGTKTSRADQPAQAAKKSQGGQQRKGAKKGKGARKARARAFAVDEAKVVAEEAFDGVWALRTNAPLEATEVACKYKQLWRVEQCFRQAKSLLRTRPIFHRTDAAIRGHVFCSFLALVLREELRRRMAERGIEAEWADLMRDLQRLQETHLRLQGKHFVVRSRTQGVVAQVVRCVGARLPPTIRQEQTASSSPATQPAGRSGPAREESAV